RGLATSRRADHHEQLAVLDVEVELADRLEPVGEALGDPSEAHGAHASPPRSSRPVRASSAYQRALAFGRRSRVTGSTSTMPNRLANPWAHSKLSSSDHTM